MKQPGRTRLKDPETIPTYTAQVRWRAPDPKGSFVWFFLPFMFAFGLSFVYSAILVHYLDDAEGFRKYYGTEIIILSGIGLMVSAVIGVWYQIRRYENMRGLVSRVSNIVTLFIDNLNLTKDTLTKKVKFLTIESEIVLLEPARAIEQATAMILTTLCSAYWQISSFQYLSRKNTSYTEIEGSDILLHLQTYPCYGFVKYSCDRMKNIEFQSISILRQLVTTIQILRSHDLFYNDERVTVLEAEIHQLIIKLNESKVIEESRIISSHLGIFKLFSVIFLLGAPFVLLPGYGPMLIVVYPITFLVVGYFISLRWFIGDIFNNASDMHASHIYKDISNLSTIISERYQHQFRRFPQNISAHHFPIVHDTNFND